ncbi:MAG: DUF3786 domain-containing protein [Clostridia bacterium]|jgi:hypothetical protein|nr:DUF3786 domain-containing protein [Clostridia bacterium]MDH7572182.1 DUF3786 domain-containing protein [Clostridia bacterium]
MEINLDFAWAKAQEDFARIDPLEAAGRAGAEPIDRSTLRLRYFGRPVLVRHPDGESRPETGPPLSRREQILLLHYLVCAGGAPPERQWISFGEIPGGTIYLQPFRQRCLRPLIRRFGTDPAALAGAAAALGGEPLALGDAACALPALPRVSLAVILWQGDDEFPANATVLFDRGVTGYLPLEDCATLAQLAAMYLVGAASGRPQTAPPELRLK